MSRFESMLSSEFDFGYVLYALTIFLPGIGVGELFKIWRLGESLSERIAIAFGLGISIDTVVLLIRTAGTGPLVGIDVGTIYALIVAGIALMAISILLRKKFAFPMKPTRGDLALFLIIIIQAFVLLLYFQKYPIFPEYQSQDFQNHILSAQGLISGSVTSVPAGLLYFAIRYQLASAILLVHGEPLVVAQRAMAIIILLSPFLFFLVGKKIFGNIERVGLIVAVIYVFSGTAWFAGVLGSGLYANFYGTLAALFFIFALINLVADPKSYVMWSVYLLSLINAYMSHYTVLTILPAILALPLIQALTNKRRSESAKWYLIAAIIAIAPIVIAVLAEPKLVSFFISLTYQSQGVLNGNTFLSNLFAASPVFSYLALEVFDDIGLVVLFLLSAVYLYRILGAEKKSPFLFVPIIWFLSLIIAAPGSLSAWRFSYEAIVPLILMASYGLASFFPGVTGTRTKTRFSERAKKQSQSSVIPRAFLILVLFGVIVVGSWGQTMVSDALTDTGVASQAQVSVYNAITWLHNNTAANSRYLSVSDWRFVYSNLIIGRYSLYQYESMPSSAIKLAKSENVSYIIVTNLVTLALPSVPSLFPWDNFPSASNSNLTLVYQNSDVRIFETGNST
jgi:hypothetical protein